LDNILDDTGKTVKGSDIDKYFFTEDGLKEKNIEILPFSADNITGNDIIIAGNAFSDNHIEIKKAQEMGVEFYRYHEFLCDWANKYMRVSVIGSHGKKS